ncbi:MAG: glycogen debranching protein GlgX [Actinomycetales bacterium]
MQVWPGRPYPLGATFDGTGTNFTLYSEIAERVELCLIGARGGENRVELTEVDASVWHCYLPGVQPGQRYGYRVHGPYDPSRGLRCHPKKLLLDPYAKAIHGQIDGDPSLFSYRFDDPSKMNNADSRTHTMTSVVINPYFDWGNDRPPHREYHESVIYEAHVKGLTMTHPGIPQELRGTYAGIGHPELIKHLQALGVTAIELMPVHQFVQDSHLQEKGLSNYWGYNTIGFFAPHNAYSASGQLGQQVTEFKGMVKALHQAGIEVILDVVYNHTAEGNSQGPTLCFRGIDNTAYYRLVDDSPEYYYDTTGTGNSLLMRHPHVLQLIMDSLRYWVLEMHVDGFRFDLAATLARQFHEVDRLSAFFDLVQQDPIVSQVKLIAEPWDLGDGGYQVGNFPPLWTEWNGKFRDTVRDFWRSEPSTLAEFASRITGSSDLYQDDGRRPIASINFVTAHDGFTMRDLVSYNEKHNEANGEGGMDGESHNRSWNCGTEGPTEDPEILALRARQQRNLMTTLLLSQGVPMIAHGDEISRSQSGNNNVYCQDNEISWMDWDLGDEQVSMLRFTQKMVALRQKHPVFRRRRFFKGRADHGGETDLGDIAWFTIRGEHMTEQDWTNGLARSMAVFLNGDAIPEPDPFGQRVVDDSFYFLLNAYYEPLDFVMPPAEYGAEWTVVIDTATDDAEALVIPAGDSITVQPRATVVLTRPRLIHASAAVEAADAGRSLQPSAPLEGPTPATMTRPPAKKSAAPGPRGLGT